jgi:hypothetical protein
MSVTIQRFLLLVCAVFAAPRQANLQVVDNWRLLASFDAISGDPEMTYKDHPDMALAACSKCGRDGQVLVVTGQDVAVFDVHGTRLKQQRTNEFLTAAGVTVGKVNDPRATYDQFIGRWIVVCSCSNDFLIVSASDDATGKWKGVALTSATGDLTMFPGWDRNAVYVSEYQQPLSSQYIALPASDVAWREPTGISLAHEAVFTERSFEMRPAVDPNPNKRPTEPEYFVARSGPPQNATNLPMDLLVDRLTWSDGRASVNGPTSIPSGFFYSKPIQVPQPAGSAVRGTESHRVFSVSAFERHLHLVVSSGPCQGSCGEQGEDPNNLFFWFDVDTATMTLSQKAKVADRALGLIFPTLAVDGRGNVFMAATGGSRKEPPSIYLASHHRDDAPNVVNGPLLVHAGRSSYVCVNPDLQRREGDVVGWGTYSATVQDGSDPAKIWTLQEYGGGTNQCEWRTRVLAFRSTVAKGGL